MILPKALIEHGCGELGGETGCEYVKQTITIWQIQKAPVAKRVGMALFTTASEMLS